MAASDRTSTRELEDAFVKITFEDDFSPPRDKGTDPLYDIWVDQASAKFHDPGSFGARTLRKLYPSHSVVLFTDGANIGFLGFPGALIKPVSPPELITSLAFVPFARRAAAQVPGRLVDQVKFGSFSVAWDKYDFLLYIVKYPQGFGEVTQHYLLHEGPEDPVRALLLAAGAWKNQLHSEVLIFNNGMWTKNHELWQEIQKADWDDVILKQEFKDAMRKDINGFFDSEDLFKSLAIPWKRGIIMHGPPGNGKTISLKAVMKECDAKNFAPLYVKSFQSWMGEEMSMATVFAKAREMTPCVLVLEDLDSLINDKNRSFFLNQLDGLESNDGLLVIGTTNHLDKLDPALSGRPSRFDRKYPFDDPDEDERALYARYWQDKLRSNKSIEFPDSLVDEVVAMTAKFSFAYLKEAFVSSLVILAGLDGTSKPPFAEVLKSQIKSLRSQLDNGLRSASSPSKIASASVPMGSRFGERGFRLPGFSDASRIWDLGVGDPRLSMPGGMPHRETAHTIGRGAGEPVSLGGTSFGRSFIS
ncbi:uncharacterized protein FIBRA_07805 [Fibroporia radiculosa]|uniref:AAA+ ATPase domain-containing protein n=1 Tax=Fibroporia radiculosa TaxID=599839 RepID=J4GFL3_9APHY|nr:uncharacterized protein FIBRA_07805 [Fibroporia radiculosa]CCM05578.1 predicted protein [Fibroporia radiculosa]